jgi:Ca2+-binding EF-hand superfamily protein
MITCDTIKQIRKIFHSYDKNQNGVLSKGELNRFCKSMNTYFTNSELDEAIYIIDENNDGKVNFQEFIQFVLEDE